MRRKLLTWLLLRSGAVALRWRFLPRKLFIFNFHRVGRPEV